MFQRRAFVAACGAAGALPELVARYVCAPSNHERHECHRPAMLAPFAMNPSPWATLLQIGERRTRATARLMALSGLPISKVPWAEVMWLAAHDSESDGPHVHIFQRRMMI
jgi:hypothetical protein